MSQANHSGQLNSERQTMPVTAATAGVALALLCLSNAFNLADRVLLGVIQEPIRLEFQLSDFELGLLGGPAFAVLYSLLSIPVARLADRANRITILSVALALWSGMTVLCGMAGSYAQLFLARVGVSVGEAGGAPPAVSYLSDIFTPERRATALAVFAIGGPAGAILATVIGGQMAQHYGWRSAFFALGGAGLVLAVVLRLTVREVRAPVAPGDTPGFLAAVRQLFRKRSYVNICAANVFAAFSLTFIGQYMTSFLIRTHELSVAQASAVLGVAAGLFGTTGAFLGGYVADRVARRRPAARTFVTAAAFVIAALSYVIAWWAPLGVAIALLFLGTLTANAFPGVSYAVASAVAPASQRATAIAFLTVAGNLLGYALGPPLLGALSDAAAGWELARQGVDPATCAIEAARCAAGQAAGLRWALSLAGVLMLGAGLHHYLVSRTLVADQEK